MAGMRMATPLLALKQGFSAMAVGALLALFALTQVFLALPAGRYADRLSINIELPTAEGLKALVEAPIGATSWKGPYVDGGKLPADAAPVGFPALALAHRRRRRGTRHRPQFLADAAEVPRAAQLSEDRIETQVDALDEHETARHRGVLGDWRRAVERVPHD